MLSKTLLDKIKAGGTCYIPCSQCDGGHRVDNEILISKELFNMIINSLEGLSQTMKWIYQEEDYNQTGITAKACYDKYGIRDEDPS